MRPSIVDNTLDLRKELPKHKVEIGRVQLCFTANPFIVDYPDVGKMSIGAIKLINERGTPCVVLTQGLLPMELAELSDANQLGHWMTLADNNPAI